MAKIHKDTSTKMSTSISLFSQHLPVSRVSIYFFQQFAHTAVPLSGTGQTGLPSLPKRINKPVLHTIFG